MASRQAIEIRVEGLEASRAALEQIIRSTRSSIPEALGVVGQAWEGEIRQRAPLKTGRLRRSYTHTVGASSGSSFVEVSSNVEYAPYQEFGTRYIVGTPHVRPATEAISRKAPALIAEGISRRRAGMRFPGAGGALPSMRGMSSRLGALGG